MYPKTPAWYIIKYVYRTYSHLTSLLVDSNKIKFRTTHSNLVVTVLKAVIALICRLPSRGTRQLPRRHSRLLQTLLLQGAELEVRLVPLSAEGDARVESCQAKACDDDHGALEDHECDFLVCECAVESLVEFCGTEDGTHEDGDGGDGEA